MDEELQNIARGGGVVGATAELQYFYNLEKSSNQIMRNNIRALKDEVDEALYKWSKRSKKYRQSEDGLREFIYLSGKRDILMRL